MQDARMRARAYTRLHGEDIPEVADWKWGAATVGLAQDSADENTPSGGDTGGDNA
jgi:xylulose-5-phosphate/fructose-6-phosphate phosphoketolase